MGIMGIKKKIDQKSRTSIVLNAVATMLVYSGHFGMCAISPGILKAFNGVRGINDHLIFTGFALSCVTTVLFCPLLAPLLSKLGTKTCLVFGGLFMGSINFTFYYPTAIGFLVGSGLNGIGCAMMRASSLKYLTDMSSPERLAANNGLHWSIFMTCIFVGNVIVLLSTGSSTSISDALRVRLCTSLVILNAAGVLIHSFIPSTRGMAYSDDESAPFLKKAGSSSSLDSTESKTTSVRESLRYLLKWRTVNTIFIMLNCGIFPTTFATFAPIFIGELMTKKAYVPIFGMFVGLGEMVGSLIAGRTISALGVKVSGGIIAAVAYLSIGLSAMLFPLGVNTPPLLSPSLALITVLGVMLGAGDATNGVLLTTIVGHLYREHTQIGFAMYAAIFNVSATAIYIISSYNTFGVMVGVFGALITLMLLSVVTLNSKALRGAPPGAP